jgi:hypothetical protein
LPRRKREHIVTTLRRAAWQKIYELRVRWQNVNYRLLYFFDGGVAAVVAHGCTKTDRVDPSDIDRAAVRRERFLSDPVGHTYKAD